MERPARRTRPGDSLPGSTLAGSACNNNGFCTLAQMLSVPALLFFIIHELEPFSRNSANTKRQRVVSFTDTNNKNY